MTETKGVKDIEIEHPKQRGNTKDTTTVTPTENIRNTSRPKTRKRRKLDVGLYCQSCYGEVNVLGIRFHIYKGIDIIVCDDCMRYKTETKRFPFNITLHVAQKITIRERRVDKLIGFSLHLLLPILLLIGIYYGIVTTQF